jgi:hypothetical protein
MIKAMYRTRHRRVDSGYASRNVSMERLQTADKTKSKSDINMAEPPKTPTKNNAAYRNENGGRSTSPKCQSVNRNRSSRYRERSPKGPRVPFVPYSKTPLFGTFLGEAHSGPHASVESADEDLDVDMDNS